MCFSIFRHVNAVDENNCTPLILACMTHEVAEEIVKELINLGADDTLADSHKETAYHFAAKYSPAKLQVGKPICIPFTNIRLRNFKLNCPFSLVCHSHVSATLEQNMLPHEKAKFVDLTFKYFRVLCHL